MMYSRNIITDSLKRIAEFIAVVSSIARAVASARAERRSGPELSIPDAATRWGSAHGASRRGPGGRARAAGWGARPPPSRAQPGLGGSLAPQQAARARPG